MRYAYGHDQLAEAVIFGYIVSCDNNVRVSMSHRLRYIEVRPALQQYKIE